MPYFISDKAKGCSGWATVKHSGAVITCHTSKKDAIAHMVALSIAEKIPPGGELGKKKESALDAMVREAEMNGGPEEWDLLDDRQREQAKDYAELATEFGMFDQTSLAKGAHYAPAAKNPFKATGIVCKNCVFFEEVNGQCQIVSGVIEPEAVCKLWVIPESKIVEG